MSVYVDSIVLIIVLRIVILLRVLIRHGLIGIILVQLKT